MKNRIITISRQFGSGGRTIGKEVAQKLGIPCYDQELIEKISEDTGLNAEFISAHTETTVYSTLIASAFNTYSASSTQDYLWDIQVKIITRLADEGPCVIVGRCADYVLDGNPDLFRVFLFSDMESKKKRIMELYSLTEKQAKDAIVKTEKTRRTYYNYYTDRTWGDVASYDLCLNVGKIGIDATIEIIKDYIVKKENANG